MTGFENLTIAELENGIRLSEETIIKPERIRQKAMHDALEAKLKLLPIAGGFGTTISPDGFDLEALVKNLNPTAMDKLKGLLGIGGK